MTSNLTLSFHGNLAERNEIQFYDVAQALWGFERTVALTTHLLLNGNVITQSPSAKGFSLIAGTPEEGSWKWPITLAVGSTIGAFGLAPPDSLFGWLAFSAVDYVVQETLGFEPNFEETLGKQIKEYRKTHVQNPIAEDLTQGRFDSLIEKTESGIRAIHRPIINSKTATNAQMSYNLGAKVGKFDGFFDAQTFEYVSKTILSEDFSEYCGAISSYNTNTMKGRLFIPEERRTVPFELADSTRTPESIRLIVDSLRSNAIIRSEDPRNTQTSICLVGVRNESTSGRLKSIYVTEVRSNAK